MAVPKKKTMATRPLVRTARARAVHMSRRGWWGEVERGVSPLRRNGVFGRDDSVVAVRSWRVEGSEEAVEGGGEEEGEQDFGDEDAGEEEDAGGGEDGEAGVEGGAGAEGRWPRGSRGGRGGGRRWPGGDGRRRC